MVEPPHGLKWVGSWEDERERFAAFPRIPVGGGLAIGPLTTIPFDPDVILIYGDPAQIIMIIQSMQRKKFERYEFACIGESSCADSLADCYLTGKPKISLPGVGERAFGHVSDSEMVIALPPAYLEMAVEGFRELHVTFPVPFVGLGMNVKPLFAGMYPDDPEFFN
jgi:uncharacterized protein (DUF169 family)